MQLLHSNGLYSNKRGGCSSPNNLNGDSSNGGSLNRGKLPRDRHGNPNNLQRGGSPNNLNGDRVSHNNRSNNNGQDVNRHKTSDRDPSGQETTVTDGETPSNT